MSAENKNDAGRAFEDRAKVDRILRAAASGDVFALESALAELDGCDKTAEAARGVKDGNKRSCMHFAALRGHEKVIRYLAGELKAPVDEVDAEGETPLLLAARGGFTAAAAALLEHGADARARGAGDDAAEAVHHAAASGNVPLLEKLLAAGAPVSAPSAAGPPLLWAAGQAHADCVEALLKTGADANARNGLGVTALVMLSALGAGIDGAAQCVKLLAAAGADVNARVDPGGGEEFTALHVAADMGSRETLSALLDAGADPNVADSAGNRPIDLAAAAGEEARAPPRTAAEAVVELLLSKTTPAKGVSSWTVKGVIAAAEKSQGAPSAAAPAQPKPQEPVKKAAPPQPPADPAKAAAAAKAKAAGDAAFAAKDYEGAIAAYTEARVATSIAHRITRDRIYALDKDPTNAAVWSNRSLCNYNVGKMEAAVTDAEAAVARKPDWGKAHYRRGAALQALERWEDAATAYFEGVQVDPGNLALGKAFREAIEGGRAAHQAELAKKEREEQAAAAGGK